MLNSIRKCQNLKCEKLETQFGDFQVCSKCKLACYCSRECQKIAWKEKHKIECSDTNFSTLKNFLQSSENKLLDTKGEKIGRYAYDFFSKYGNKEMNQFVVVKINILNNTASFSIGKEDDINKVKKLNLKISKSILHICIIDIQSDNIEILTTEAVTQFNSKIIAQHIIKM
jgi:hypothetical protein